MTDKIRIAIDMDEVIADTIDKFIELYKREHNTVIRLDEMTGKALRTEFARLVKENGKTAVFITHSINEALEIGDRIIVLKRPANIAVDLPLTSETTVTEKEAIRNQIQTVLAA